MSFGGSSSGGSIHTASDVALNNPSNGQLLGYNSGLQKWQNQTITSGSNLFVNVKDYNATGNGTTNDTTALTAAINAVNTAGGGIVFFPAGTYLTGQLTIYANMTFVGSGPGSSIIQLASGSNTDLVITDQFSSLTGGNSNGPSKFGFRDITLDANRANQTADAWCARIYGYNYTVYNTWFINGYGGGVYSEWGGSDNPMEVFYDNFKIWNYGGRPGVIGLLWNGPHDSVLTNGTVATLDSTIRPTDATYGTTPINGSTLTLPTAGTSFSFTTTTAAAVATYPTGGGSFVVPVSSGLNVFAPISYTSASTSGGVTTFNGCTSTVNARPITASGGIVVPSYGIFDHGYVEGAGHGGAGEVFNAVHVWGRNHFAWYTTSTIFVSNSEAEGAFISNVVLASANNTWIGASIYGTNGQTGQVNEVGLQLGDSVRACGHSIITTTIYNVGSASSSNGASVITTSSSGNNMIRVVGTTTNTNRYASPYAAADYFEAVCHNHPTLSVYQTQANGNPWQFTSGLQPGNVSSVTTSSRIFSGSGAPNIATSVAGDFYFRSDTPGVTNQRLYIASGVNTWTGIL